MYFYHLCYLLSLCIKVHCQAIFFSKNIGGGIIIPRVEACKLSLARFLCFATFASGGGGGGSVTPGDFRN